MSSVLPCPCCGLPTRLPHSHYPPDRTPTNCTCPYPASRMDARREAIAEAARRLQGPWEGSYGIEGIDVKTKRVTGAYMDRELFYSDAAICARVALEAMERKADWIHCPEADDDHSFFDPEMVDCAGDESDPESCFSEHVELIRRPTGGTRSE